ncbi:MAG: GDSL-type esterase/lipase family protein [Abditibacteriales bacterium]|nr:GDSL-type esterase/lipase family protein [Abditibacteriales bacterium]MDW8368494.1 GDSL-type esterase/lipase family protein [Abditibacteriales bacterium]
MSREQAVYKGVNVQRTPDLNQLRCLCHAPILPYTSPSLLLLLLSLLCLVSTPGCRKKRPAAPPAPRPVYVAMGASDTQSVGASRQEMGYVYQILRRLRAETGANWKLENVGKSGALVTDLAERQLPLAVRFKPKVVTLWTGGNDVRGDISLQTFEENLERIFQTLTTKTDAVIAAANLPRMSEQPFAAAMSAAEKRQMQTRADAINAITTRLAQKYGVHVVDLGAGDLMYNPANMAADGLHLNDAGHTGLAERFWAVLSETVQAKK